MVFPLYDENPLKLPKPPYVTWALIGVNIAVFLFQTSSSAEMQRALLVSLAGIPATLTREVTIGVLPPELTLVTSMFVHGGWEHILGNMIYLWVFGDDIEEALGPLRFLAFYPLCGVLASLAYVAVNLHQTTPLVGASGAISGVLAAYLMLRPCAKVSVFVLRVVVRVRAYWVIGGWVLLQVVLFELANANDNVAYVAHLGGLAAGAALFLLMKPASVRLFECVGEADTWRSIVGR